MPKKDAVKIQKETFTYSPLSRLNTLEVYHINADKKKASDHWKKEQTYWIIFIHGGAWRDPKVDASAVEPALSHLGPVSYYVEGVASLNYRLSPVANQPTDDPARNARHPDHIEDVMTAIAWLQHKYGFGEKYALIGHSAGAMLSYQAVSGIWKPRQSTAEYPLAEFVTPLAVAGVAGIYDLDELIKSFPTYRGFVESAFGEDEDEETWSRASPTQFFELESSWPNAKFAGVTDSHEDELIDHTQGTEMFNHLKDWPQADRKNFHLALRETHDGIWKNGTQLSIVIIHVLNLLTKKL